MLYNFRDLGGLNTKCLKKTKPGLLFRTADLSHLAENTAVQLSNDKGLRVYIDFRTPDEIKNFGKPDQLISQKVEWLNLPIFTDDPEFQSLDRPNIEDWLGLYQRLYQENSDTWIKFLNIIAEADAPVAYGCLFGKDRTGIASSILLEALNVQDEHIENDYAETANHIEPLYRRFKSLWKNRPINEAEIFAHFLQTPSLLMRDFLKHLRSQAVTEQAKLLLEHLPFDTRTKLQLRLLSAE